VKIAVTGATGFIGGAIVREACSRGHEVVALYRGAPPVAGPSARWEPLEAWLGGSDDVDVVVHAAALRHRHGVHDSDYGQVNEELTRRALRRATRGAAQRFVLISSIAVYGWPIGDHLPIDESFAADPVGSYGRSKVVTETLVTNAATPWTIVQPSITYGPGDTNGMIDKMMRMIARHAFVIPGLGRSRVQLVYIDDLARITIDAATTAIAARARFICTYRSPIRVRDLVLKIARVVGGRVAPLGPPTALLGIAARGFEALEKVGAFSGREPPLTREKLATISVDRAYRIDHMRSLLGTEPHVDYDEGLLRTARALNLA
jgi:nucleoside-diphosphate-sugar epimerase